MYVPGIFPVFERNKWLKYPRDPWAAPSDSRNIVHYYQRHRPESLQLVTSRLIGQTYEAGLNTPVDSLGIRLWQSALDPSPQRISAPPLEVVDSHGVPATFLNSKFCHDNSCCSTELRSASQFAQSLPLSGAVVAIAEDVRFARDPVHPLPTDTNTNHSSSHVEEYESYNSSRADRAAGIDFQRVTTGLEEPIDLDNQIYPRRLSGSSNMSSNGAVSEMQGTAIYSQTPSYSSDYTPGSYSNISATPMSMSQSPRYMPDEPSCAGGPRRISPSSHSSTRSGPYTRCSPANRWSTGSYQSPPVKRKSSLSQSTRDEYSSELTTLANIDSAFPKENGFHSTPNLTSGTEFHFVTDTPSFHQLTPVLPTSFNTPNHLQTESVHSHSLARSLQSSGDSCYGLPDHCSEDPTPPNLYASLAREELDPPEEDMYPEDKSRIPYREEPRFDGDLYTTRWIRGHGNDREAWCGLCRPGKWLQLKRSAFWYDRCNIHGVSNATGRAFAAPKQMRKLEEPEHAWEALCGECGQWIEMKSANKKPTTWFRHAYKCHNHEKVKDMRNRKRQSSDTRKRSSSNRSTTPPESSFSTGLPSVTPVLADLTVPYGGLLPGRATEPVPRNNYFVKPHHTSTPQFDHYFQPYQY